MRRARPLLVLPPFFLPNRYLTYTVLTSRGFHIPTGGNRGNRGKENHVRATRRHSGTFRFVQAAPRPRPGPRSARRAARPPLQDRPPPHARGPRPVRGPAARPARHDRLAAEVAARQR